MKILLFTQTGDARPKCVKQFGADRARGLQYLGHLVRPESGRWLYWLVECENAEDGRAIIIQERVFDGTGIRSTLGRILASGGRDGGK